ncbi:MAG: hypothetical protein JO261_13335 [Alphaproteobacteria bacterium]|nr:hypothetical protein [Alphaproteobacteria bacterium]MBV9694675.1 hypothetical protein [Alphaproteobacteria bacterium]
MRFSIAGILFAAATLAPGAASASGLGAILTTKDGGQVFGFDIDRHGNDGVLASGQTIDANGDVRVSVETFDQDTGKIVKSFAKYTGMRNEYSVDGIFAGDVALVTHYITPKGTIFAKRKYETMNPVTGNRFSGDWTPPVKDIDVLQAGVNQDTSQAVLFAIELKKQDNPILLVSDIAAGTFSNLIHLDPGLFGGADGPVLSQYTSAGKAVIALSPDAGKVGGAAPLNVIIDLSSGQMQQFNGYNNGEFHAGSVNGLAVDPNTGVGATTTELNAQVEFYDMAAGKPITFVQLPCTGDTSQSNSGAGIAVDPVNKLFLVTDPFYCDGSQGSALVIYDEQGNLVDTITGFHFAIGEPAPVVNPSKRMGWVFAGPGGFSQLTQFFY